MCLLQDEEYRRVCHFENFSPEVSPYLSKQFTKAFHLSLIHSTRMRYICVSETHSGTCHCSTLHDVVFQHSFFFLSFVFLLSRQEWVGVETSLRLVRWLLSFQIILSLRLPLTVGHCSAWQAGRASSPLICA